MYKKSFIDHDAYFSSRILLQHETSNFYDRLDKIIYDQ